MKNKQDDKVLLHTGEDNAEAIFTPHSVKQLQEATFNDKSM